MMDMSKRALKASDGTDKTKAAIVVGSVGAALIFGIILFFIYRSLRYPKAVGQARSRKSKQSWTRSLRSVLSGGRNGNSSSTGNAQEMTQDPEVGVVRHTSIRSIATLPAYSAVPRENEGILGREGDRAGMDTVVEFPETTHEEESRREEEMESLWRIRQERRREAAEREDRRRRRREARARGDSEALNALRHETMLRVTLERANGSNVLIAEHNSRPRERRISTVSYGDIGVARHDGTRVRGNSTESDSRPLLEATPGTPSAGPIRPWLSRGPFSTHHRMASASSVLTTDSVNSDMEGSDFEVISLQHTLSRPRSSRVNSRAHSLSLSLRRTSTQAPRVDGDLGESQIPLPEPPHYESMGFDEAPPYEQVGSARPSLSLDIDRQSQRHSQSGVLSLPEITRLPSIRINEPSPTRTPSPMFLGNPRPTTASTIDEETN